MQNYANLARHTSSVLGKQSSSSRHKAVGSFFGSRKLQLRLFNTCQYRSSKETIFPGMASQYGSLDDPSRAKAAASAESKAWQAADISEVQRVTQKALIYELSNEQSKTIENVVPWFLQNMPDA